MSDNQEAAEKRYQIADFKDEPLSLVRPELLQMMKKPVEEKVPVLSQKRFQIQGDLNTSIINWLKTGIEEGDLEGAAQRAIEALRKRNEELKLLEMDPNAMKKVEQFETLTAIMGSSSSTDSARLIAILQLTAADKTSRNSSQHQPKKWFRPAGSFYKPGGVRT
ncbi:ATP-dependent protease [Caenorhabditis elegans]|uniref:ATP-dependent protease n=1 Tax=Caenorhabditis elegans TaxID=6239 RepID=Q19363_CAEEL|nr:ATP-dependent protease [Caenorhabditis elegans]CCD69318.1 ATP-dependent protease [Caenorhabditis elegans]|eukprot:NP_509465.1 Uncharacterized protein CELE_F12D9.2 [Caenorhabditis elegans]